MKNLQHFILIISSLLVFAACEKNEAFEQDPATSYSTEQASTEIPENLDNRSEYLRWLEEEYEEETSYDTKSAVPYNEYQVNATCNSNNLVFAVKGAPAPAAVKLYNSASQQTTYYPMASSIRARDLQEVIINLPSTGNWTYEYVDAQDQTGFPNSRVYNLRNTAVVINPEQVTSLYWPFGQDRSSWNDRGNWNYATPYSAHSNFDDNAQVWNWGKGHQDLGKLINAPLEGRVIYAANFPVYGNVVDILHESEGKKYIFRVAHLDEVEVEKGDLVNNTTLLGTLGRTGSGVNPQYPEAYCVLYQIDNNNNIMRSLPFKFSAVCQQ